MKHAKKLSEPTFDWDKAKELQGKVQNNDGSFNMFVAAGADPGVTSCPNCKEYFWDEAEVLQCTECGTKFNSTTKEIL